MKAPSLQSKLRTQESNRATFYIGIFTFYLVVVEKLGVLQCSSLKKKLYSMCISTLYFKKNMYTHFVVITCL